MTPIAHISSPFGSKFGVPRQSGLTTGEAFVVFEPDYRIEEAVRGLDEFDYIWLVWQFHQVADRGWHPTVRPPRLGGNQRVGVFASRSPFRPNAIGLSCVRLLRVEKGPRLVVEGADMVDGTPILDIKPYLPYADAHPEARSGFAYGAPAPSLRVVDPHGCLQSLSEADQRTFRECLSLDPRPHYQHSPQRIYAMPFGNVEVRFRVDGEVLTVVELV